MIHQGERLPLRFEAGDHLPRVHAGLEDLQRDFAADRLLLLGHEDDAEAAFADLFQELVWTDDDAGAPGGGVIDGGDPLTPVPSPPRRARGVDLLTPSRGRAEID